MTEPRSSAGSPGSDVVEAAGRGVDPSRVAILCHGDETYGVGTAVKVYARYMRDALFVAMGEGALTDHLRKAGCRVEVAGVDWWFVAGDSARTLMRLPGALREARRAAERLWPVLRANRIQVFHSQWLPQQLMGGYLRERGLLNIWHIQNNTNRRRLFGLGIKLNHLMARQRADLVMAVSGFIARNWEGCGRPVLRVWNAANPIYEEVSPFPAGPLRCVMAGRLEESKGHHLAVEAVVAARRAGIDVRLDIFGGPLDANAYCDRLRRRIAETSNQAAIVLKGFVNDLRERHPAYHLGLQCRIDPEPCSLWVCETHADGLPLLASASGGTPELVVEGETGRLYEPGNQAEITEKLQEMLRDPGQLQRMRVAAFERGRRVFHPERMVAETLRAYERAAQSSGVSLEG